MKKLITLSGILFCMLLGTLHAQTQIGQTVVGSTGDYQGVTDINGDGTIMITGAPQIANGEDGYARVFEFDGTDWVQMGTDLLPENAGDQLGWNVAINEAGDIVAVHSRFNDDGGTNASQAQVYQYDGTDWVQMGGDIEGEIIGDSSMGFGDVDLSNDGTILAFSEGQYDGNGINGGRIRVFEFDGTNWVQQGNALEGEVNSWAGYRVSLNNDGTRLTLASSESNTENGYGTGKVGVYEFNGTDWLQIGEDILGEVEYRYFGWDAVLNGDGDIVAVSASKIGEDGDGGSIRVFQFDGTDWVQLGQEIYGDQLSAEGFEVSINGDGTVISFGIHGYTSSNVNVGIVRIYKYNGTEWIQRGIDIEGLGDDSHEGFSTSLSEDGSILVTGAYGFSFSAGSARVFDLTEILSIDAISNELGVILYPNPANNILNIAGNTNELQVSIYDTLGRELFSQTIMNQLDVSWLQSGTYILQLSDGTKNTTSKLIKM